MSGMIRFVIIGGVVALAFTLFSLVDAAMSEPSRSRGVSKPVWVVLTILLPVVGGILWFMIGKGPVGATARPRAVEDQPGFSGTRMSNAELDAHMRELEERLRELDAETFPGEHSGGSRNADGDGANGTSGTNGASTTAGASGSNSTHGAQTEAGAEAESTPDDDAPSASGR